MAMETPPPVRDAVSAASRHVLKHHMFVITDTLRNLPQFCHIAELSDTYIHFLFCQDLFSMIEYGD